MGDLHRLDGYQSPARTRVLLALLQVYRRDGWASVPAVAETAGVCRSVAHFHLRRLQAEGLVALTPGQQGTLRPLVEVVANG